MIRKREKITTRLWIDRDCIASLSPVSDEEISRWVNVQVSKVHVDILVSDVDPELVQFIYDERESPRGIHHGVAPDNSRYASLTAAYEAVGKHVLTAALTTFNRFVAFARNHKGQHWLSEWQINLQRLPSFNNLFNARTRSDNGEWFRWCPPGEDHRTIYLADDETAIKETEWQHLQNFVGGDARPTLALELLANAERLLDEGYRRSAIIESASALEITVFEFGRNPLLDDLPNRHAGSRFDKQHLSDQIKHLGFSGSIRYLLPVLFPTVVLPDNVLVRCQEIVSIRNSVVHSGQRDVDETKARSLISSARKACTIIKQYTRAPQPED